MIDAAVPDDVLVLDETFLLELVFAEELVFLLELVFAETMVGGATPEDVPLRNGTELETDATGAEDAVPVGGATGPEDIACEEVPTGTILDEA